MDTSTKHVTLIYERFGDIRLEDLDASRVPPFPQESKSHMYKGRAADADAIHDAAYRPIQGLFSSPLFSSEGPNEMKRSQS